MSKNKKNTSGIPQYEIDALARTMLPAILSFYRSEEGQREFAEWKANRNKQSQLNRTLNNVFEGPHDSMWM